MSIGPKNDEWRTPPKKGKTETVYTDEVQAVYPEYVKLTGCTLIIDVQSLPFQIRPGDQLKLSTR